MKFEDMEEKTIERDVLFSGNIIQVAVDEVALPNGGVATRELVFHNGGVAVLAVTEDNRIVLVGQFRKPLEKVILEIPAGKIEKDEQSHLETAKRELEEETGYQSKDFRFLMEFALSPGFSNEILYLYEAKQLVKVENPLPQDDDEVLELHYLTLEEAKEAIRDQRIYDAKTILAILYWEMNQFKK